MHRKGKLIFLLVAGILMAKPAYNQKQSDSSYRNSIKLNVAAFVFRNASWLYERQVSDHISLQLGGGFKWGGGIPKALGLGNFMVSSNSAGLKGYSFTPEVRYYFSKCECNGTMTGLYSGVYSRLTQLNSDLSFSFQGENQYIDASGSGSFRELGIGIQLGYQFAISKRLLVDFMFMGPRTSIHKLKLQFESEYANEILPRIEEELNKKLEYLGRDPVSLPNSASPEVKFGFNYFRYGISIGYMF